MPAPADVRPATAVADDLVVLPDDAVLGLQRSLLPRALPASDELEVAAGWSPGRRDAAGDWYDVLALGGGRLGIVVGDVAGRGIRAVALMASLRTAVRTCARLDLPPHEVLGVLDALVAEVGEEALATCLYAVFDPHTLDLQVAGAGCPPPVLRAPSGGVEVLRFEASAPLGTGDVARSARVPLPPGAVLALCTDGLLRGARDVDLGVLALATGLVHGGDGLDALATGVLADLAPAATGRDDAVLVLVRVPLDVAARSRTVVVPVHRERTRLAHVRARTRAAMQAWALVPEVTEAAVVLTGELATNALLHGRGRVEVRLRLTRDRLVVEVADEGHHLPRRRPATVDAEVGRGLELVSRLAQRWGSRLTDQGKLVWAELDLAAT